MKSNPDRPFNDLPDLPPPIEIETPAVLKAAIRANRLLAELKGYCQTLPNPDLILSTILLQESRDSSAIENIVTTQDELYQAIATPNDASHTTPGAKEVLRYREAIETGRRELERTGVLSTNLMVGVMQRLRNTTEGVRRIPGIRLGNPVTGETLYTPPEGEALLRDKLQALERFIHDDAVELDPLVVMALMHYQFEAIHPFSDGNGRTGRILNVLFLVQKGLLVQPILYLSDYIMRHRTQYYSALRAVTVEGAWVEWVLYMLQGVGETSSRTLEMIKQIGQLRAAMLEEARAALRTGPVRELIDLMFSYPYLKIRTLEDAGVAKRQTASNYLHTLADAGLLQTRKEGKEVYFINRKLLELVAGE